MELSVDRPLDLRVSGGDLLVPSVGLRNSSSTDFQGISEEVLKLSPANRRKKELLFQQIASDLPLFDFTARLSDAEEDVRHILLHFFPTSDPATTKVRLTFLLAKSSVDVFLLCYQLTQLVGGITNVLYLAKGIPKVNKVLIRVSGEHTENLIDRDQELVTLMSLASIGVGPSIYGRFKNGLLYGFVEGNAVESEQLKDPVVSRLTAEHLGFFHAKCDVAGVPREPILFDTISKWLNTAQIDQPADVSESLSEIGFSFAKSKEIVLELEAQMDSASLLVCFCHNDLLSGNVIFEPEAAGGPAVHFIDFEYGGYNYRGFDIGNHFCEMMGFELDDSKYPTEHFQREWIASYLRSFLHHSDLQEPEDWDIQVERLRKQVQLFSILAHLFWGIWAVIQHQYATVKEFDYLSYARLRLSTFIRLFNSKGHRIVLTALDTPPPKTI